MITDQQLKDMIQKLEPVIGYEVARTLWMKYLITRTPEKKEAYRQKISIAAEQLLNLYKDQILLTPPERGAVQGDIPVGQVIYNEKRLYDFNMKKEDLIRHVAIFGKTGSGKTNLAFHIIQNLLSQGVPFIVFDWKRNFRDLLKIPEFRNTLKFFTVGRDLLPFYFNPKNKPNSCDEEVYQKKLCEIIEWAYFLGFGAHDVMMDAYDKGNFKEMKEWLARQRKNGREMLWWASGKRTLNSINFGGLGRMVNHPKPFNIKNLLKQNVILEIDGLSEPEKCFVIGSLLNWIQEFRKAQPDREVLKHCLIFEEAHHIFRKKPETKPEDITDLIFREIREYGESIIILDQHAHKTSTQALGNTNVRIAMQTDLYQDVKALADCMMLEKEEETYIGRLKVGQAIVKTGNAEKPFLISIPKFEIRKGTITDYELAKTFNKKMSRTKPSETPPTPEAENEDI